MRYLIVISALLMGCSSPDPAPPPAPQPTQHQKVCGETDIQCNCTNTSAYPGEVTNTSLCESGQHQFLSCGYCPGGGLAWHTVCYCP